MGGRNPNVCAAGVALALLLSGCVGGDDTGTSGEPEDRAQGVSIVQPGAPGEPSKEITAEEARAAADTPYTDDDVDFMQGMLHHHAQALVMTELAADRATGRIALLAERIDLSQKAEMDIMGDWLSKRDEQIPDAEDHAHEHGPDGELMPGMVGRRELARLAAAEGKAFNRLFVDYMVRHHQGALTMVADLRGTDRAGEEPELDAFARHVDADQAIEITRLEEFRAKLPAGPEDAELDFSGTPPQLCILE